MLKVLKLGTLVVGIVRSTRSFKCKVSLLRAMGSARAEYSWKSTSGSQSEVLAPAGERFCGMGVLSSWRARRAVRSIRRRAQDLR